MANVISALITNQGHVVLAQSFGGPSGSFPWSYGQYFKLGTAGWQQVGPDKQPQTPNPALLDVQSVVSGVFYYQKTFISADILFIGPSSIQFRAFLDLTQGNGNAILEPDTGVGIDGPKNTSTLGGGAPAFFEIGVFDLQNNMVAYGTFPEEVKLLTKTLNHLVTIQF